jgi:hypothetical protein
MLDLLILPLLAASAAAAEPAGPPRTGIGRTDAVFISPMGEPFRTAGEREDLAGRWLAGADVDHDGVLALAEMEADAARFFATLDGNGDGEIDPAEIERYESVVAPEIRRLSYRSPPGGGVRGHGGHGVSGEIRRGEGGGRRRAERSGTPISLLGLPEPVTAADADFNRGISRAEFKRAAGERFVLLDANRDGRIEPAELVPYRPRRAAAPDRAREVD